MATHAVHYFFDYVPTKAEFTLSRSLVISTFTDTFWNQVSVKHFSNTPRIAVKYTTGVKMPMRRKHGAAPPQARAGEQVFQLVSIVWLRAVWKQNASAENVKCCNSDPK